jgi:N-acetylglucosaminyldiphosphoundecaprenol N-acetyl-beta-D-mannosaminyltransferase
MAKKEVKILGVKISNFSQAEVLTKVEAMIEGSGKHLIVTPNPEFLLETRKDEDFLNILNGADLSLSDGFGLKLAAWVKGIRLRRYTGAALTKDLLALAEVRAWPVAVINWHAGLSTAKDISQTIKKLYPNLKCLVKDERRGDYVFDTSEIKHFQPKIILATLGAPYQEKLLVKLLDRNLAKLGVGVGGSFDYLTGKAQRAPKILQSIGLEWLWRLALAPRKRARRIYRAVISFPLIFAREEVFSRLFYRPCVVGWLFKDDEVLMVNANSGNGNGLDHWKLPQGGVEVNESKHEAFMREMAEELGTVNFDIIGRFNNIYKYKWPREYRMGYKGQRQTLFICRYNGQTDDIKLSHENKAYKWVKIYDLIKSAEPIRRGAYALFLQKFQEAIK